MRLHCWKMPGSHQKSSSSFLERFFLENFLEFSVVFLKFSCFCSGFSGVFLEFSRVFLKFSWSSLGFSSFAVT